MKYLSLLFGGLLGAGLLLTPYQISQAQGLGGLAQAPGAGIPQAPEAPSRSPTVAPPQDAAPAIPYLAVGATANGSAMDVSNAWFIDSVNNRVVLCTKSGALPASCESIKIPAATP